MVEDYCGAAQWRMFLIQAELFIVLLDRTNSVSVLSVTPGRNALLRFLR